MFAILFPNIDPIAINLGIISIHWYGISYVIGIFLGAYILQKMKKDNKILDDLAKLAGSTLTGAVNAKNEISEYITQQIEKLIKKMNFVTREEFDVVKKLAQDNRLMLEKMKMKKTTVKKSVKSVKK